jgi:hypothetical protein
MVNRARPRSERVDPLCPVCLALIKATDRVTGVRDDLMHEQCDYARAAMVPFTKQPQHADLRADVH